MAKDEGDFRTFSKESSFKFKKKKVEQQKESQFKTDKERFDFNVWLEHYHIKGKGINYHSSKKSVRGQKFIIIKDETNNYVNLYINSPEFEKWLNEKIKQYKQHE